MKKILSTCIVATFVLCFSQSTSWGHEEAEGSLGLTLDNTYSSKYMWRGYDLFGANGAYMPSLDVDLYETGWSFNVWGAIPLGSGSESLTESDYTFAYATTLGEGETSQVDLGANWIYYDFPKASSKATPDAVEFGIGAEWPNLLADCGVVPSVYFGMLDSARDNVGIAVDGNYASIALSYDFDALGLGFNLTGDVNYNDGLFDADHDWSHSTLNLSTGFDCGSFAVSPFVSFQKTFEKSVNPDGDEIWGGVSASISF